MSGISINAPGRLVAAPGALAGDDVTASRTASPLIRIRGLAREFEGASGWIRALQDIDLDVQRGEFCVVVGPSGCGKTTLLRILAGLDRPTSGSLELNGPVGKT